MSSSLGSRGRSGCWGGGGDVTKRRLAVSGLRSGRVVSQWARTPFSLSTKQKKFFFLFLQTGPYHHPDFPNEKGIYLVHYAIWFHILAGGRRSFIDGHEESRGGDFFKLRLFTRIEEDHR